MSDTNSTVDNKVMDLREAIDRYIKDGMMLYMDNSGAAGYEIIRQFWGKHPYFTVIMNMFSGPVVGGLIHGGLLKKGIFCNCSDIFPKPTPTAVIQRAYSGKTVELESWTMGTINNALTAGTLQLPFMPTRSIIGTSMAEENKHSFTMVDDPFGNGKIGAVKAFVPDMALVHAWAADTAGNVIVGPGGMGDPAGVTASKGGAIVTVERIVSTDFIMEHPQFSRISRYWVTAVCLAPHGGHPHSISGLNDPGPSAFEDYNEDIYMMDRKFLQEYRQASEDPGTLDEWIAEWVLNCKTQSDYVEKLGAQPLSELKVGGGSSTRQSRKTAEVKKPDVQRPYNDVEFFIIGAIRKLKEITLKNDYKTIFAGVGLSALAGWGSVISLEDVGHQLDMLVPIPLGYGAPPRRVVPGGGGASGAAVGGVNSSCIGLLAAAQIDKYGNMNSTKIDENTFIAGPSGGGDVAVGAREVVVVTRQRKGRFLDKVPYITMSGTNVSTLVTEEGIFEKNGGPEFVLTEYFPRQNVPDKDERIRQIGETLGWELKVSPQVKEASPPITEELELLRSLDPDGMWTSR
ncbi:CoA-transferase [Chloroflexota bacterium]